MMKKKIAIIGEFNSGFLSHTRLNDALEHVKTRYGYDFGYDWLDTPPVEKSSETLLTGYSGIWSAPGSPFLSLEGSLAAIAFARKNRVPHLGTCAGFQHTIIEFARNVLGEKEAQHEEYDPESDCLFISRLSCSLSGKEMQIYLKEGSLARSCYGKKEVIENYYCNFGINPQFKSRLVHPNLQISGVDQDGEIRIIEIPENPFFVATLFVPQTRSTPEHPHPLIKAFVEACLTN